MIYSSLVYSFAMIYKTHINEVLYIIQNKQSKQQKQHFRNIYKLTYIMANGS